jgi:8-oxo-dGTP diphosphatase
LLARRLTPHEHGKYGPPGGKVDYGESPDMGALREVLEEVGIVPPTLIAIPMVSSEVYPADQRHFLVFWFLGHVTKSEMDISFVEKDASGNPKHEPWEWFPIDNLPTPLMRSVREVIEGQLLSRRTGLRITHNPGTWRS